MRMTKGIYRLKWDTSKQVFEMPENISKRICLRQEKQSFFHCCPSRQAWYELTETGHEARPKQLLCGLETS